MVFDIGAMFLHLLFGPDISLADFKETSALFTNSQRGLYKSFSGQGIQDNVDALPSSRLFNIIAKRQTARVENMLYSLRS